MISIVLSVAGGLGVFEKLGITQDEAAQVIDLGIAFAMGLSALYFNYVNHKKMR